MKISRLISLVFLLLRQEMVPATQLATLFEVSVRTIYRDLDTLNEAGIPIFTKQGRYGGVGIMPNYKVDKKLLTQTDLDNLLIALSGTTTLLATPELLETLNRIKGLSAVSEDLVPVIIEYQGWPGTVALQERATALLTAIRQHRIVKFTYTDRGGQMSQRILEPYRIVFKAQRWYLQGFDTTRHALRTFTLAKLTMIEYSAETFEPRSISAGELVLHGEPKPQQETTLLLAVAERLRDVFVERFGPDVINETDGQTFHATIGLPNNDASYRFLLGLGQGVQILNRLRFKTDFRAYAKALVHQL